MTIKWWKLHCLDLLNWIEKLYGAVYFEEYVKEFLNLWLPDEPVNLVPTPQNIYVNDSLLSEIKKSCHRQYMLPLKSFLSFLVALVS